MARKFLVFAAVLLAAIIAGCSTPEPMSIPPYKNKSKKKMCVGHNCREMSAVEGSGTTRGYKDDQDEDE